MTKISRGRVQVRHTSLFMLFLTGLLLAGPSVTPGASGQASSLPSETPEKVIPATDSFDYVKRDVMIPMRDGVKLHTVVVIPKGAKNAPRRNAECCGERIRRPR